MSKFSLLKKEFSAKQEIPKEEYEESKKSLSPKEFDMNFFKIYHEYEPDDTKYYKIKAKDDEINDNELDTYLLYEVLKELKKNVRNNRFIKRFIIIYSILTVIAAIIIAIYLYSNINSNQENNNMSNQIFAGEEIMRNNKDSVEAAYVFNDATLSDEYGR